MAGIRMEVDPPMSSITVTHSAPATLKRSSSAPMINMLAPCSDPHAPGPSNLNSNSSNGNPPQVKVSADGSSASGSNNQSIAGSVLNKTSESMRTRRFSASYSNTMHSPNAYKNASRLNQIKREEAVRDVREMAHERDVQTTMQMSQSWEELSLDEPMITESHPKETKRPKSFQEPLHIFTSPFPYSGSPSPTRVGKQCFSPSLQAPVKNSTLTPSLSPSPTRKSFVARRSLSPIIKPSPLSGIKRKMDMDDDCGYSPASKRLSLGSNTPEKTVSHPLMHSMSSNHTEHSPDESTPSNSEIRITTSTPANCFTFRPVRDSVETRSHTDSETSDMAEPSEISETTNSSQCQSNLSEHIPRSAFTKMPPRV